MYRNNLKFMDFCKGKSRQMNSLCQGVGLKGKLFGKNCKSVLICDISDIEHVLLL